MGGRPKTNFKLRHYRYLAEFDFRYSNRIKLGIDDKMRAAKIVEGAKGKRLLYRRPASLSLA